MFKHNLIRLTLILSIFVTINHALSSFSSLGCILGLTKESPFCSWATSKSSEQDLWKVGGPNPANVTGIGFNGAINPPFPYIYGTYIQVYGRPSKWSITLTDLISPILQPKETTDCFSFYYYIHGESVGNIRLNIVINGNTKEIWKRIYSAGDMWHYNRINIPAQKENYQLKFLITAGDGAIALGYLRADSGICTLDSSPFVCDFEGGNCNWTSTSTNPNYQFNLTQATTIDELYDHTTETNFGHFMEASGGNNEDVTNLASPWFFGNSLPYCMTFWYWRHSSKLNKIEVLTHSPYSTPQTKISWTSNDTFPNKTWHRARVDFYMFITEQITIQATHLANQVSTVDIDDIILSPGICQPAINCDFDSDMCGWSRDMTQDWVWDLGIGRVENPKVLPEGITHAPKPQDLDRGMFMYTDFTTMIKGTNGKMVMMSEIVPATTSSCLTFYYIPLSFNDTNNKFQILLQNVNGYENTVFTMGMANYSSTWTKHSLSISINQSFRIVFQVSTQVPSTYLAIDNIKYQSGTCSVNV